MKKPSVTQDSGVNLPKRRRRNHVGLSGSKLSYVRSLWCAAQGHRTKHVADDEWIGHDENARPPRQTKREISWPFRLILEVKRYGNWRGGEGRGNKCSRCFLLYFFC